MNGWIITLLIVIAILIWLRIDFKLGLRQQRKEATRHIQETRYSEVDFLPTGDDFYKRLFADIQQATGHIHLLFYIIKNDHISKKLLKILEDKAKEGVAVRLLVDKFGCKISRKNRKKLKQAGIKFAYSHPPSFPYIFFTFNRRNHRKIVIVDGRVGYIGGFNIGDEYLGRDPNFGAWRDFHLRLDGDGVQDLQEQFLQDWQTARQKHMVKESHYPSLKQGQVPLRILPTDGTYLEETFISLVKQAKEKLIIGTPYYIPGKEFQNELIAAAKRGVDVTLIIPKKADHSIVKEAAFPYFEPLLLAGINVYQYYRGFFHAKVVTVDLQVCDIGTANIDQRSFHINHEINCLIYDETFIRGVLTELEYDISRSERLTIEAFRSRSLFQKGKEKVAKLVSGLL
ncbi:cardiolipin synthase [Alkalihalobacillus deserti]|uniref:cardiolipin synthase n=1 Tax=Alkalihalobacillus deserti TaxID=2879466 RepID=UPI001D1537FF|nr:cardiolipin synthase [Alkalihalobacillus deserti]